MSPPVAPCWESRASGARADGQRCSLVTTRRWGQRMHGMHGTLDAELEVRRIKRAELMALLCLLRRIIGPTTAHVDNKGIIDGLWRGEFEVQWPKSKGRRLVDLGVKRIAQSSSRRHTGGRSSTRQSASIQAGEAAPVTPRKFLSPRAMRRQTSQQKGKRWMEERWCG